MTVVCRPATPPTLASLAAPAAAQRGGDQMTGMELRGMPDSLEMLATQWQLDYAQQQQAEGREQAAAAQQVAQQAAAQQAAQWQHAAAGQRAAQWQHAAAGQRAALLQLQQQQQQQAANQDALQQAVNQEALQLNALAYLSAAQQGRSAAMHMWQDARSDGLSGAFSGGGLAGGGGADGGGFPSASPPLGLDPLQYLATQQAEWAAALSAAGAGAANPTFPHGGFAPPSHEGAPRFGAEPAPVGSLQWLAEQQRQQGALQQMERERLQQEQLQQEQLARLLHAQQFGASGFQPLPASSGFQQLHQQRPPGAAGCYGGFLSLPSLPQAITHPL